MSSADGYRRTAISLRSDGQRALSNYAEALAEAERTGGSHLGAPKLAHANNLIIQGVGLQIAAAMFAMADALETL